MSTKRVCDNNQTKGRLMLKHQYKIVSVSETGFVVKGEFDAGRVNLFEKLGKDTTLYIFTAQEIDDILNRLIRKRKRV
jgi:hypothetical protein